MVHELKKRRLKVQKVQTNKRQTEKSIIAAALKLVFLFLKMSGVEDFSEELLPQIVKMKWGETEYLSAQSAQSASCQ